MRWLIIFTMILSAAPAYAGNSGDPAEADGGAGQSNLPQISATLQGNNITLGNGRAFALEYRKEQLVIYPILEVKEPVGARVELYYGDNLKKADEAPCVFNNLEIDQYVKIVVKEKTGTWSVKFMPQKQGRTTLVAAGGAPASSEAPAPTGGSSCKKTLLAKGFDSSQLIHCEDVDQACAVAALEAGRQPAELVHCSAGLPIACVKAILKNGHPTSALIHCEDVDVSCAVAVLNKGEPPSSLVNCGE